MTAIRLNDINTRADEDKDKKEIKEKTAEMLEELNELQYLLYAEGKKSLLVILQGMDASGKDGVIRNVFGGHKKIIYIKFISNSRLQFINYY